MKRVEVPSYTATIYVGGFYFEALTICRDYCDSVGMCVSVTETRFVYTGGETDGVAVGFINYGRFPSTPDAIFAHAEALALKLIDGLGQESASIVATDRTVWLSRRQEDSAANTQALASGKAEVAPQVSQPIREEQETHLAPPEGDDPL